MAENEMLQPIVVGGLQGTFGASIVFGGFYAIATVIVVNMKFYNDHGILMANTSLSLTVKKLRN